MIYIFKCTTCIKIDKLYMPFENKLPIVGYYTFEVNQPMMMEHVANCPICNEPAERVWTMPAIYTPWDLWNEDGSRQDDSELPRVYTGHNKFFSGFGDRRK